MGGTQSTFLVDQDINILSQALAGQPNKDPVSNIVLRMQQRPILLNPTPLQQAKAQIEQERKSTPPPREDQPDLAKQTTQHSKHSEHKPSATANADEQKSETQTSYVKNLEEEVKRLKDVIMWQK